MLGNDRRGLLLASIVIVGLGLVVEIASVLDDYLVALLWLVRTIALF